MTRRARITVVTSGHLSTCPRMLKSADALAEAGYNVHVVATSTEPLKTLTVAYAMIVSPHFATAESCGAGRFTTRATRLRQSAV